MSYGSEFDFDSLFDYNYNNTRDPHEVDHDAVVNITEETPLLSAVPAEQNAAWRVKDIAIIALLVVTLLGGLSIAVYLMVIQHNEDHVIPPVDEQPARCVNIEQGQSGLAVIPTPPFHAETVILEQTGTGECQSSESCAPILREMKAKFGVNKTLPYNFLLSSDGTAYKGLGWCELSPSYSEPKPLVLAFIGNYINVSPNVEQIELTKSLISGFLKRDILLKNYTISGQLYEKFKDSPQWKEIGSGSLYSM